MSVFEGSYQSKKINWQEDMTSVRNKVAQLGQYDVAHCKGKAQQICLQASEAKRVKLNCS